MPRLGSVLLGRGKLPRAARAALEAEGMVVLREGVGGSVTFRRFHAPGKRCSLLRRKWFSAALAVTEHRLVAYVFGRRIIDLARDDARLSRLEVRAEKPSLLCLAFDAGALATGYSGRVEYRFRVADAQRFVDLLRVSR